MHQFYKFILSWKSTCFEQFVCPSSGIYSPYTQQWYMSYRFVDSFRTGPSWSCSKAVYIPVWHIPLLSAQWTNSWWWTDELSETCRVSWPNKFVKLAHLIGFITNRLHVGRFERSGWHRSNENLGLVWNIRNCDKLSRWYWWGGPRFSELNLLVRDWCVGRLHEFI
jgi:hypothetical protein